MKRRHRERGWLPKWLFGDMEETGEAAHAPQRELRVFVEAEGKRLHVGSLTEEDGLFVFRYSRAFKEQESVPPLPGFPDVGEPYKSDALWPFFRVRLPPTNREDVKRVMEEHAIAKDDLFRLLDKLGRRTITTPYELELFEDVKRGSWPSSPARAS